MAEWSLGNIYKENIQLVEFRKEANSLNYLADNLKCI
jgi:hypothetical protein